ncbi:MAG TPA: hypothetical protein PKE42_08720 [Arachnia sp.]|nr:hypothetical protein [Arachnia sp.]
MYYRDPELTDWGALEAVTFGGETSRAMGDIADAREMNLKQRGDAIFRDVVIDEPKTNSDGARHSVVSYCEDPSHLDLVNTSTGDPVPRTLEDTLVSRVTMRLLPDGSWRATLYESKFQQC